MVAISLFSKCWSYVVLMMMIRVVPKVELLYLALYYDSSLYAVINKFIALASLDLLLSSDGTGVAYDLAHNLSISVVCCTPKFIWNVGKLKL